MAQLNVRSENAAAVGRIGVALYPPAVSGDDEHSVAERGADDDPGLRPWVARNAGVALTIGGVLLYSVLRLSAVMFYSRLGFTPEEVGLGYVETLAWMLGALLIVIVIRVLVKLFVPHLAADVDYVIRWIRRKPGLSHDEQVAEYERRSGGLRRLTEPRDLTVTLSVALLAPLVFAAVTGPAAARGEPIEYLPFRPIWRAEAARVHALDGITLPIGVECVLFVGESEGVYALYDPGTQQAWRVPVSSVVIETGGDLEDVEILPRDCPWRGEIASS